MEEKDFCEAVRSGLGRGILYARDHDVGRFRDVILDACMHCYSADPQTEGTRAPYMLELTDTMPDREFYRNEVLNSLSHSQDDWDTVQRFRIASYLAMDGDDRARRAMYENFDPAEVGGGDMHRFRSDGRFGRIPFRSRQDGQTAYNQRG